MSKIEDWEIKKYSKIFNELDPINQKLKKENVIQMLLNFGIDELKILKILNLSDIDNDSELDFDEFCVCMRLIFDVMNKTIINIPESLPLWIIPSSKLKIFNEKNEVKELGYKFNEKPNENNFNWEIPQNDKKKYYSIINISTNSAGMIEFKSLNLIYDIFKNVSKNNIESAWNLLNPESQKSINKDQALLFLHILHLKEKGIEIPKTLPLNLQLKLFKNETLTQKHNSSNFIPSDKSNFDDNNFKLKLKDIKNENNHFKNDEHIDKHFNFKLDNLIKVKNEFSEILEFKKKKLEAFKNLNQKVLNDFNKEISSIEDQVIILKKFLFQKKEDLDIINKQINQIKI